MSTKVPCPICALRPGGCMNLCTAGQVDVDALARSLADDEWGLLHAEMGKPAIPMTDQQFELVREIWIERARGYLQTLSEIYTLSHPTLPAGSWEQTTRPDERPR